jgi:type IV secretion system protein VirD4
MPEPITGALGGIALLAAWLRARYKDREKRREFYREWQSFNPDEIFGQAKFADEAMLEKAGVFENRGGVPVAWFKGKSGYRRLYHNHPTSILTLGRSGDGKGSTALLPSILESPHLSWVIPDIDGEALNVTAPHRSKSSELHIMDAYEMYPNVVPHIARARYNPIGRPWLNPAHPQFWPRCAKRGAGVIPKTNGRDQYWYSGSQQMTTDFIMTLAMYANPSKANLTRVAEIVQDDPFRFARWVIERVDDPYLQARLQRWSNPNALDIRSLPEVAENTKTQLNPWLDPSIAALSGDSTFSFSECAERVMTAYILAPHENLDAGVAKTTSTFLTCALTELIRFIPDRRVRTVVLLDEAYELPGDNWDHFLISARKANTVMWFCMQDLAELRDMYPTTTETFINNCGCLQLLGCADLQGSQFFSQLLGEKQVTVVNKNQTWPASAGVSDPPTWQELSQLGSTTNLSVMPRPLMLPQEIRALSETENQILFMRGVPAPILAEKRSYLDVPHLARIAGQNPFYRRSGGRAIAGGDQWMRLLA